MKLSRWNCRDGAFVVSGSCRGGAVVAAGGSCRDRAIKLFAVELLPVVLVVVVAGCSWGLFVDCFSVKHSVVLYFKALVRRSFL